jgi:hypothetical protein
MEAGEETTDAAATAFWPLLHLPEIQKLQYCLLGEKLLLLLLLQLHAAHWVQQQQNLNQIKQLVLDRSTRMHLSESFED